MKNLYTSKKFQRMAFLFAIILSVGLVVSSCKKDDDEDAFKDHVVVFEVKASAGVVVKSINTQIGTSPATDFDPYPSSPTPPTTPPALKWTSGEFYVNSSQAAVYLSSNATPAGADSELITNIYIDGVLKKSDTAKNMSPLISKINYTFVGLEY